MAFHSVLRRTLLCPLPSMTPPSHRFSWFLCLKVSPRKADSRQTKGWFYFDARLTEGKKTARMFSFETAHMEVLKKAAEEQTVIALENCDVKSSKFTGSLEVQLQRHTKVVASPRKLNVGEGSGGAVGAQFTKVAQLKSVAIGEKISLKCKVVRVSEPETVTKKATGKKLQKQDVKVADESGHCRLVLWEEDVNGMEEGRTYLLGDVAVRKYNFKRYLAYNRESSREVTDDLQDVDDDDSENDGADDEVQLSAFDSVLDEMVREIQGTSLALKLLAAPPQCYHYNEEKKVFAFSKVWAE